MHEIDHVEWAEKVTLTCYGVRFAIRANSLDALRFLQRYLPPKCRRISAAVEDRLYSVVIGSLDKRLGVKEFNLLCRNSTLLTNSRRLQDVVSAFESDLKLYVAESSPSGIFIHSGVVGWKGKGILIPGYSFSGKSTLVSELVQAGATYYSDEYAVIDNQGDVRPYPRPLHLRDDKDSGRTIKYPLEALGRVPGFRPIPVGLVFVSQYKPGAVWQARRLLAGQGLLELLSHTATARTRPKASLIALQKIATRSTILKGPRGEARDTVKALLQEVSRH
jgi:hypothetical protein